MKILHVAGVALSLILVAGCASSRWVKSGGTDQELARAKTDCRLKVAATRRLTSGDVGWMTKGDSDVQECMMGEGWALQRDE